VKVRFTAVLGHLLARGALDYLGRRGFQRTNKRDTAIVLMLSQLKLHVEQEVLELPLQPQAGFQNGIGHCRDLRRIKDGAIQHDHLGIAHQAGQWSA